MSPPVVGLLSIEGHLPEARSLKDKRRILRAVKDRLGSLNVAVAEVEHHDLWQRIGLAVVTVGSARVPVERVMEAAVSEIEKKAPGLITQTHFEWLS